jgi:hypothetical protein
MKFAMYANDGAITRIVETPANGVPLALGEVGSVVFDVEGDDTTHRIEAGALVAIQPDPASELSKAKQTKRAYINWLADKNQSSPILFSGALFDADAVARERISGTLARLTRGDGLPIGWVGWRDAGNTLHWSDLDAEHVAQLLSALSASIEDRVQSSLLCAWQHKANVDTLEDVATVERYDATVGWP